MTKPFPVSRRGFLKGTSAAAAGLVTLPVLQQLTPVLRRLTAKLPWYRQAQKQTYTVCDMCPWRCGIVATTVNGRVVKLDGNPKDPKSRGMLCARGQGGVSFIYDPDRLKQPMIRVGARGEGKFKNATWKEALDYTAEKMARVRDQYGPEGMAFLGHTNNDFWFVDHFPQAFGSPNAAKPSSSMCTSPREEASLITFGRAVGNHEPVDWDASRCLTLIGTHIGEDARNTTMQDLANAKARGATLIVVDPRFSSVAMKADFWLPIKPGTDTALLLAWANVLIAENLIDRAYIDKWASGFDELAKHVAPFTPEWAAPITDLSADLIRNTAREMGRDRPQSVIVPGRHVVWYGNDTQRMRMVYIINALLGAYGREGGIYFSKTPYLEEYPHPPYAVVGGAGG